MVGSGARVTSIRPYAEAPLSMYLDGDGRATFESQFYAGFKILVYPEAVLGPDKNIRIKVLDTDETETQPVMVLAQALINGEQTQGAGNLASSTTACAEPTCSSRFC